MAMLATKFSERSGEAANKRSDNYSCEGRGGGEKKIDLLSPTRSGEGGGKDREQ